MSFLDDIIDPDYGQISETTRRRLEYMISIALLDGEERTRYENRAIFLTEEDAQEIMNELKERMPIMGLHNWPLDMKQQYDAIQYQVAKDDLHEIRFKR
jgi:hypothetical protein